MKKLSLYMLLISLVAFSSCETEQEDEVYGGETYYHFDVAAASADEDTPLPIEIPVIFTKPTPMSGEVTFSITSSDNATEGVDFVVGNSSNVLSYDGDTYISTITIFAIGNSVQDGDKFIYIDLSSSERVGFPGAAANNSSFTLTLSDNDCPTPLVGSYTHVTSGCQGDGAGGCGNGPFQFNDWNQDISFSFISCEQDGKYGISDITMGLYSAYNGGDGTVNDAVLIVNGSDIIVITEESADDVYGGDQFSGSGTVNSDGTIALSWTNTYGDQGETVLTPQ